MNELETDLRNYDLKFIEQKNQINAYFSQIQILEVMHHDKKDHHQEFVTKENSYLKETNSQLEENVSRLHTELLEARKNLREV